jgi:hypothetical protein
MRRYLPDPTTRCGALFYGVSGALLGGGALDLLHHIQLIWH